MDEYLNELIAYLVIGAGAVFVAVTGFMSLRRRLRIRRSTRRHQLSGARLPDRPALIVVPAEGIASEPSVAEVDPIDPPDTHALDFFHAFEDRLAQIRAEIEALDTSSTR